MNPKWFHEEPCSNSDWEWSRSSFWEYNIRIFNKDYFPCLKYTNKSDEWVEDDKRWEYTRKLECRYSKKSDTLSFCLFLLKRMSTANPEVFNLEIGMLMDERDYREYVSSSSSSNKTDLWIFCERDDVFGENVSEWHSNIFMEQLLLIYHNYWAFQNYSSISSPRIFSSISMIKS